MLVRHVYHNMINLNCHKTVLCVRKEIRYGNTELDKAVENLWSGILNI